MDISLTAVVAGAALGLALIVAIGAQNAFVLRQGLRGEHVRAVVAVCVLSDVALIAAGVAGAGALLEREPAAVTLVRWAGAAFLLAYAGLAARRALRPGSLQAAAGPASSLRTSLLTALALTWLNPHVYLDTVLLLGSVGAAQGDQRWAFAGGAALASLLWFAGLGAGARLLRPWFARPAAWRLLDAGVAVVMAAIAVALVRSG